MTSPLRVLVLEDQPLDAELAVTELCRAGFEPEWRRVDTEEEYLSSLDESWDLILADYRLPQFDALRALDLLQERELGIPLIVMTGALGDGAAAECMRHGAVDYFLKDRLARLGPAVTHALERQRRLDERHVAEQQIRDLNTQARQEFEERKALLAGARCLLWHATAEEREGTFYWEIHSEQGDSAQRFLPLDLSTGETYNWAWRQSIDPEDRARMDVTADRALREKQPGYSHEYRCVDRNGTTRWLHEDVTIDPIGDHLHRLIGVVIDNTEQKKAEESLAWQSKSNASLAELSQTLIASDDMDKISKLVLDHARAATGSPHGFVGYVHPATGYLVVSSFTREIWGTSPIEEDAPVFKEFPGLLGWVLDNQRTLVTNHPSEDPRSSRVPEGHLPIDRFLGAPAVIDGASVGMIFLANAEHEYTERDARFLERLASAYAIAVQGWRRKNDLFASEERFRTVFNSAAMGIALLDRSGAFSQTNPALRKMLGYSEEELSAWTFLDVTPEEDQERSRQAYKGLVEGQSRQNHITKRYRCKDGRILWVEIDAVGVYDAEDAFLHAFTMIEDVTEQKRTQDSLTWEAGLNVSVAGLSRSLLSSGNIAEISRLVLESALDFTDSKMGLVAYLDSETGDLVSPTSTSEVWGPAERADGRTVFHELSEPWKRILDRRESMVSNAVEDIPYHRFVGAPAIIDGDLVGIVAIADGSRDYTGHDLIMAESFAAFYAIAIQQARKEQALQEREHQLRVTTDAVPVMIAHLDGEQRYLFANAAYQRFLDLPPSEIVGCTSAEVLGQEAYEKIRGPIEGALAGEQVHIEMVVTDGSEETRYLSATCTPDFDAKGDAQGVVVSVVNITSQKESEQEIQETNRQLQRALEELRDTQQQILQQERLRALGQMASGIAHDFNNALSPILGFSELLLSRPQNIEDTEKATRYLGIINTAAKDAANIVSRMREFYRKREEGDILRPVDLLQEISQAILLTQPKWKDEAQALGAAIAIHIEDGETPAILGNESELRETLTNLIFNACDAMPDGGDITIRTRVEVDDRVLDHRIQAEWALLEVVDTGDGMPEDVRKRCLEPFFTTKGVQGTGMGLAMVYGIMQRHDGEIEIDSDEGEGTTITLRFPVPREEGAYQDDAATEEVSSAMRILVVDDEPMVREVTAEYLLADGHTVETAVDGVEALEVFEKGEFDLIITDRSMPKMSGDQLAKIIKERSPDTLILMLTGFGVVMNHPPDDVDGVASKPITLAELRQAVMRVTRLE